VAARDAGRVALIDAVDLTLRWTTRLPDGPVRVAFAGDQVLASLALSGSLAFLDSKTGRLTGVIPIGALPDGIAVDSDRSLAYVAAVGDDMVAVVDTERRRVVGQRPAGDGPSGVLLVNR